MGGTAVLVLTRPIPSPPTPAHVAREIRIHSDASHGPHILPLLAAIREPDGSVVVFLEYCPEGDLYKVGRPSEELCPERAHLSRPLPETSPAAPAHQRADEREAGGRHGDPSPARVARLPAQPPDPAP